MSEVPVSCDVSRWSGDGALTQRLVAHLRTLVAIGDLRVEDAPASRFETGYHFVSNEIFIRFARRPRVERTRRFGFLPVSRTVFEPAMSLADLTPLLTAEAEIGAPDYADDGMLQYLRTERIVAAYQTRGFKQVEMVRLYAMPAEPLAGAP